MRNFVAYSIGLAIGTLLYCFAVSAKEVRIDFFVQDGTQQFGMEIANYLQVLAEEQNVSVQLHDAKNDSTAQLEQLKKADGDVMVMETVLPGKIDVQLQQAQKKNVRLIYFNYQPLPSEFASYANMWYAGSDYKECAKTLADNLLTYTVANPWHDLDGDGVFKILYLQGPTQDLTAEALLTDFTGQLDAQGFQYKLINNRLNCSWNYNRAYSYIENLCQQDQFETFDALVCANDELAMAAIDAFEDLKPGFIGSFNLPVFSIDGLLSTHTYLKQGLLTATVNRQSLKIARLILKLCQKQESELNNTEFVKVDRQFFIPVKTLMFNSEELRAPEQASDEK